MREIGGKIEGDILVEEDSLFTGMVAGNMTVASSRIVELRGMLCGDLLAADGATITINGMVDGDVIAEEGSTVEIHGMVDGVVRNHGASVSIWGTVDAISDRQPGITTVHPGAVVRQRTG